jgi:hypothetical protein
MFRSIYLTGFMFSLALSLSGCGNSGGNQTAGIDGSGAPVATTTSGTIDGFGSVIVNGLRYNSDKAQVLINGETAMEDNLRVGYQVRITGSTAADGSATADKIEFIPALVGAIEQINASSNSVMLLGQQVYITNNTIFDSAISPKNITGLAVGNNILVSGSLTIDGNVSATRIDVISANQIQLSGFIRELDESDSSFKLNQQQVKFAAAQLVNVDNNRLQNGMLVSVTGALDDSKQLHATRITTINPHLPHSIKKADVEGFITRFASTADFDVAGTSIITNAQTRYENGNVTYLLPGAKIVAKGTVDNAGKLVAEKIEFEPRSNNKISGTVTSLQIANNSGIVTGQLELDGTLIQTSINTRYEDKGHSHIKRFNFGTIQVGDYLDIAGYSSGVGFIATKIEREEADEDIHERKFEGRVNGIGVNTFTLFGRTITTDENTEFRAGDGDTITAGEFFAQAFGKHVEVHGSRSDGVFLATRVELEDDADGILKP